VVSCTVACIFLFFFSFIIITAPSAIVWRMSVRVSVRPSVTLMIPDHICWATWNFITRLISPMSSFAVRKMSAI